MKLAEAPITETHDDIAIPVSVNGRDLLMTIGTGSPLTFLFKRKAVEMKLDLQTLDWLNDTRAPGSQMTRIDSLAIGPWEALRGKIIVTDGQIDDLPDNLAGVLGEDFLQKFDFEIDLKGHKAIFYQAQGCSETSPPLSPESYAFIPFKVTSPQYWARILFETQVDNHPLTAMFGTDYAHTRLSEQAALSIGIDLKAATPIAADLPSDQGGNGLWMVKFDAFKIGEEEIKPVWLRAGGASPDFHLSGSEWRLGMQEGYWHLVLGRDFLRAHRVMVSHSQKRLYYAYQGGQIFLRN